MGSGGGGTPRCSPAASHSTGLVQPPSWPGLFGPFWSLTSLQQWRWSELICLWYHRYKSSKISNYGICSHTTGGFLSLLDCEATSWHCSLWLHKKIVFLFTHELWNSTMTAQFVWKSNVVLKNPKEISISSDLLYRGVVAHVFCYQVNESSICLS